MAQTVKTFKINNVASAKACTGNAASASKLEHAVQLSLSGAAQADSVVIDGTAEQVTLNVTDVTVEAANIQGDIVAKSAETAKTAETAQSAETAQTAEKLAVAVQINGVDFDGSKAITVADDTKLSKSGGDITGSLVFKNPDGTDVLGTLSGTAYTGKAATAGTADTAAECTGNAVTATTATKANEATVAGKLKTPVNVSITNGATAAAVPFDGSQDLTLEVIELQGAELVGDTTINTSGKAATAGVADRASECTGNAATASKLQQGRAINLTGTANGQATFDGSTDITITTTAAGTRSK